MNVRKSAALVLFICAAQSRAELSAGFWFPPTYAPASIVETPIDVLFIQIGTIRSDNSVDSAWYWERRLPRAKSYWFVYRVDEPGIPALETIPKISEQLTGFQNIARESNLNIAGVQLDVNAPANALSQYAAFLREFRKSIPTDLKISITAPLNWFRPGTALTDIINQADEFVPLFYNLSEKGEDGKQALIASPIDGARWGPIFNRYGKPFRVAISSSGRTRLVPKDLPPPNQYVNIGFWNELAPLDLARNPAFDLTPSRNSAGELILNYRAKRKTHIGKYTRFDAGETQQFTLATPESIQTAMRGVRQIGGKLTGVIFYSWPGEPDKISMQPDEVLTAAGFPDRPPQTRVTTINGNCASVECVDVYLLTTAPFSPKPLSYHIRTSTPLEYFLPEPNMPVQVTGSSQLDVTLPPYCARGRLFLGKAISIEPAKFSVEDQP